MYMSQKFYRNILNCSQFNINVVRKSTWNSSFESLDFTYKVNGVSTNIPQIKYMWQVRVQSTFFMFLLWASDHWHINLNVLHIILHSKHSSLVQAITPIEQVCSNTNKFPDDDFVGCSMHQKHLFFYNKFRLKGL